MRQLYALRVASRPARVAEDGAVVLAAAGQRSFRGLAFSDELSKVNEFEVLLCVGLVFVSDRVEAHERPDAGREAVPLHRAYLFDVLLAREEGLQLGLPHDEVDGLDAHGVKKANAGVVVVHVGDVGLEPLNAVLGPDAREAPGAPIPLLLVGQVPRLHAASQGLAERLALPVGGPLVGAELALGVGLALAEEGPVRLLLAVEIEVVQIRFLLDVEAVVVEVFVVLLGEVYGDQLARVARSSLLVGAPLGVGDFVGVVDAGSGLRLRGILV